MPVIGIPVDQLIKKIERPIDRDELIRQLEYLGCDVEGYSSLWRIKCDKCSYIHEFTETESLPGKCQNCSAEFSADLGFSRLEDIEVVRMELLAVRPDMFDVGGLARAIRGYMGFEMGLKTYPLAESTLSVIQTGASLKSGAPRPFIRCAVVRGVSFDDDSIKSIMKLQDNLHWAMGRNRKHASIGIYDLSRITGPVTYDVVSREGIRFCPLGGMEGEITGVFTPQQILDSHPKGRMYSNLLDGFDMVPILMDSANQVLSMPPIINSNETRVELSTSDLFIDVTGSNDRIISKVLNVLVTSILELFPGANVEKVRISSGNTEVESPDFSTVNVDVEIEKALSIIGISVDNARVVDLFRRMRHDAEVLSNNTGVVRVTVPCYRNDILHPRDLAEDLAIAFGYHNIVTSLVPTFTVGSELPISKLLQETRNMMVGQGYLEVIALMLTNETTHFTNFNREAGTDHIVIQNPASSEQSMVRSEVLPGLMEILSGNTHNQLPQRIFEVGDVSLISPEAETGAIERKHLGAAYVGPRAGYADVRSSSKAILNNLGLDFFLVPVEREYLISGRGAAIMAEAKKPSSPEKSVEIGTLGELHPSVLENFKIVNPVSFFELDLSMISELMDQ